MSTRLDKLKDAHLLTCQDCRQLVQTVWKFQATALVGVRHLLKLLESEHKTPDVPPDPLLVEIKQDTEENALLESKSFLEIEIKPEKTKAETDVKPEPPADSGSSATVSCESDVEDSIPAAPVQNTARLAPPARHTLTVPPLKVASEAPRSILNTANKVPQRNRKLATALQNNESKSVTFTHLPLPGRGGAARGRRGINQILKTVIMPTLTPKPTSSGSTPAPAAGEQDTQLPDAPSPSPWYVRVITEAEILAERSAARGAAEFVGAALRCEPCVLAFRGQLEADEHSKLHLASAGDYECQTCTQRLPTIKALQEHSEQHSVRYFCCYCRYSTADAVAITRHSCDAKQLKWESSSFTKNLVYLSKTRRKIPKPSKCKLCYRGYNDDAALQRHMERCHSKPPEPQTCKLCGKQCPNETVMRKHMYNHKYKEINSQKPLKADQYCAECNVTFTQPSAYRLHMRLTLRHSSKDSWKFQCHDCGKKFQAKCVVKKHILMVHGKESDRPLKCDKCSKTFVTPSSLRQHAVCHAPGPRPRPHVCHRCGKAFTIRKTLEEHLLMHEGLRPHACPLCPATFTFSAALYTHNRLKHLNIKGKWKKKPKKGKKQEGKEAKGVVESLEDSMKLQAGNED